MFSLPRGKIMPVLHATPYTAMNLGQLLLLRNSRALTAWSRNLCKPLTCECLRRSHPGRQSKKEAIMDGTCVDRSPPYASKPAMVILMLAMIVFLTSMMEQTMYKKDHRRLGQSSTYLPDHHQHHHHINNTPVLPPPSIQTPISFTIR